MMVLMREKGGERKREREGERESAFTFEERRHFIEFAFQ
jgi:hypothetical protein